jgi:hypothetical protein
VLEQTAAIKELAKQNKDPLAGPLRLGVIYTIGPYLLPPLVKGMIDKVPQMPLILQENFTVKLLEMLRQGEPGRRHHGAAAAGTRHGHAGAVRRTVRGRHAGPTRGPSARASPPTT